jgi:hypothetical protein
MEKKRIGIPIWTNCEKFGKFFRGILVMHPFILFPLEKDTTSGRG